MRSYVHGCDPLLLSDYCCSGMKKIDYNVMYYSITCSHTVALQDVERLERDNPLQNSDPFGNMDDYIQYSGTSARQSTYQQGKM